MCGFERRLYMLYVYDIHATVILLAHDSFHIFPFSFFLSWSSDQMWIMDRSSSTWKKKKNPYRD